MLNRKCLNTWIRLFAITVLISCSSKNLKISKKGDLDDAIKIAITDYAIWAKKKYNNQPITFYVDIDQENQYVYSFSIGPSPTTSYYNYYFCKNNLNKKIKVRSSNSEDFSKLRRKFSCK